MTFVVLHGQAHKIQKSGEWTPASITGLQAWYDFSDATTLFTDAGTTPVASDADKIYQANDKSGNNRHLTQTTEGARPLYKVNIQNGKSAALGDGSSRYLSNLSWWSVGTSNYTILLVGKPQSATRQSYQIRKNAGSNPVIYHYYNISAKERWNHRDDAGVEVDSAWDISSSNWYLSTVIRSTTTFSRYINNGSAASQTDTIGQTTTDNFYLFSNTGIANFHDGYIGEFIIYSQALSAGDFALIKAYINAKWAVY